jgi:ATP-dependent Lhr-like helicase
MSGCVEIRSIDMEHPDQFPDVLNAADSLMNFFGMKGQDIVRIREVLNTDASELDEKMKKTLKKKGYHFINGFYAKGKFIPKTFTDEEIMSYVIKKQRAPPSLRYRTAAEAIADRGYIRTDAEMLTRVVERTPLKRLAERGDMMQMSLVPGFQGFTTKRYAQLCRAAKNAETDAEMKSLLSLIKERQPVPRKEILEHSPFASDITLDVLGRLMHASVICTDGVRSYHEVPESSIAQREAIKEILKMHFKCFGIFSAEHLYRFILCFRMGELRAALAELENENYLVKGFFRTDDPLVMWMLSEDIDKKIETADEMFLLNTQDNLHVYLRHFMKQDYGASENAVISGTKMIGSFKGKLTVTGAKIDDLKGTDDAVKFVKDTATALGVSSDKRKKEEDKDWDVCEFYHKTHPGSIKK